MMKKKDFYDPIILGVERRPNNEIWANSDARKGGAPDGY